MSMDPVTLVERIHQLLGYPLAFVVAPAALLTWRNGRVHRRWGLAYVGTMAALYGLGTWLTFVRHPLDSETFRRNLAFNLLGFWLLFLGWRAVKLFLRREESSPGALDWTLLFVMAAASVALFAFGNGTMKRIALLGALLTAVDAIDLRRGFASRLRLYGRHLRYMLASYYYVLTVVSIVHLTILPRRVKWLAPVALGLLVITVAHYALRCEGEKRRRLLDLCVRTTVGVAWAIALYVIWAVASGRLDPFGLSQE